jgi:hypothetical protein
LTVRTAELTPEETATDAVRSVDLTTLLRPAAGTVSIICASLLLPRLANR